MTLSPRLKWKINRYSKQVDERLDRARNFFKSVMHKQKMCPACRALVDRKEQVCPFCGEKIAGMGHGGIGRLLDAVVPQQARYTSFLLTANLILFLLTLVASHQGRGGGFDARALFGSIDAYTLVRFGAKYGVLIAAGEWWRFLTPIFLHGSVIHLAFNSWVLFDLGPAVEGIYGPQKFLVLYILTGAAGVAVSLFWRPYSISIGASGALFGLIGAMIAYGYRNRGRIGDTVRNMFVRWAIYGLVFGFLVPGLDNAAHIGGLLAGIAFGSVVSDVPSFTRTSISLWKLLQTLVALLVVYGFIRVGLSQPP